MRPYSLLLITALGLSACAPRALYFHETTKVAFAADYNTSDSQPVATSFGFKRRIVAVVPSQERDIPAGGSERSGTNSGEALSLVSKFNVRAGTSEGIVITNNFASGMAARIMTRTVGSSQAVNVLMHSAPIAFAPETGRTIAGNTPVAEAVNERLARIAAKEVSGSNAPKPEKALPKFPKEEQQPAPPKPEKPLPKLPSDNGEPAPPKPEKPLPLLPR